MKQLNLLAMPNQSLSATLDKRYWKLDVKVARSMMIMDISCDHELVISGVRMLPNAPVIPYKYLSERGNFLLLTETEALPWWEEFGRSQALVFLTPEELGLA